MSGMDAERAAEPGLPAEVLAVWALFAVVALEIFATYWRLPARELYHVSGSGPAGGGSRVLLFLDYPTALVAIAVLVLLADLLATRLTTAVAFGGFGATIEKTEDFAAAFKAAQASGKPAILHLKVDPQAISPATTIDAIRAKALAARDS